MLRDCLRHGQMTSRGRWRGRLTLPPCLATAWAAAYAAGTPPCRWLLGGPSCVWAALPESGG
eukprot:8644733-Alexandrium_andersonii.AAC.1